MTDEQLTAIRRRQVEDLKELRRQTGVDLANRETPDERARRLVREREAARSRTRRRLDLSRQDLLVGGSCWPEP
jgi:hypothetical protein